MRLLLDTNIYLEVLLNQDRADESRALLSAVQSHEFFVSDYSIHSIGLRLFKLKRSSEFRKFLEDMIDRAGTVPLSCSVSELAALADRAPRLGLDFDDSYQYWLAERDDLTIVSYDSDFDRTPRGRTTPASLIAGSTA